MQHATGLISISADPPDELTSSHISRLIADVRTLFIEALFPQRLGLCRQALKGELLCVCHLDGRGFSLDGPFAFQDVPDALVSDADALGDPRGSLTDARNQLVGIVGGGVIEFCVGCHVTSG